MELTTKPRRTQKYLIFDTESVWDPYLREAYEIIDKDSDHARMGCCKLVAITIWDIEIDVLGRLSTGSLQTWLAKDGQTEADILKSAFKAIRQYPEHVLVGHGSIAHDCQIIMLAAMSADLELPRQLQPTDGPRWRDLRHIDTGLRMKGGGKTWHHLSEVLLRLRLPVALLLGKVDPNVRPGSVPWAQLSEHCEKDVLFAALVLTAILRLDGEVPASITGMHLVLCEAFLRRRPNAICAPLLRKHTDDLHSAIAPLTAAA